MQIVVGVKFKDSNKVYFFLPNKLELNVGDEVVVQTAFGLELGIVHETNIELNESEISEPLKKVIRVASSKDKQIREESYQKENEILLKAKEIIKQKNINMPLTRVKASFDSKNLLFIYTTDERVDFRELLKEFTNKFKAKIEFKQIGTRDEAKIIGGMGPCGKECCCAHYLTLFPTTNIKMAKNQGLSLNPYSINGLCGKLMCCLSYENDFYAEVLEEMPKIGKKVITPDGEGVAAFIDVFKKNVTVRFVGDDGVQKLKEYAVGDLKFDK